MFDPTQSPAQGVPIGTPVAGARRSIQGAQKGHLTHSPRKGVKGKIMSNDTNAPVVDGTTETDESAETAETTSTTTIGTFETIDLNTYQSYDKGAKATYLSNAKKAVSQAIRDKRFEDANLLQCHIDDIVDAAKSDKSASKAPIALLVAKRVAMLRTAADRIEAGLTVPDGVLSDTYDADAYESDLSDFAGSPEMADFMAVDWNEADIKVIDRIASEKVRRSPKLGDVLDHVNWVITDKKWETGEFHKVSDLCVESPIYPTKPDGGYSALNGRISAMLTGMIKGTRSEPDALFTAKTMIQGEKARLGVDVA